jgi:hypothetical protein
MRGLGEDAANQGTIQTIYAADLLFILGCGFAKISILMLLGHLSVSKVHIRITRITIYVTVAWMTAAFFALAFQCGMPHPWATESGRCFDKVRISTLTPMATLTSRKFAFWVAIAPVDIIIELVVVSLPVFMMASVKVAFSRKVVVVVAFFFRIAYVYYYSPPMILTPASPFYSPPWYQE